MSDDEYEGLPSTFAAMCRKADAARSKLRPDPKTESLRRLISDDVSLERAWNEINEAARKRYNAAPQATVEALTYALSIRNTTALQEPKIREWLPQLSEDQLIEISSRLLRLKPEVMRKRAPTARPWTPDEVKALFRVRR